MRAVAPELIGLSCTGSICVDGASGYKAAAGLYAEALDFVDASVGMIQNSPRAIFCSSEAGFQSSGLGKRSAATLGAVAVVISPRAWKPYYARHEIIHYLQDERLGTLKASRDSQGFIEGMAYGLGEDPRPHLAKPFQGYHSPFLQRYDRVGKDELCEGARGL